MTDDELKEAAILARQLHCKHGFGKGLADPERICVHCGITERKWQEIKPVWHGLMTP